MDLQKKRFMNLRPAVIISAGLISGILLGYAFTYLSKVLAVIFFCVLICILLGFTFYYFALSKKLKGAFTISIILAVILGVLVISLDVFSPYDKEGVSVFNGYVVKLYSEELSSDGYTYSIALKGDFLDCKSAKAYAEFSSKTRIFQGSKIRLIGEFTLADSLSEFSFSTGIRYFCKVDESSVYASGFYGIIPTLKHGLLMRFEEFLPSTSALNYALLTGETVYIPNDVMLDYQNVGIAHLFAVSGLHIGLMYGILAMLMKWVKAKPLLRFLILELVLFCYVGFCGFSASSMRAFIIISVREIAFLLGLKPDKTTNLSISAFIVLLINPSDLFSVGFLLSFSVYLGLILLATPLAKTLSKIFPQIISKALSSCIVAEIISLPILVDFFGKCSAFGFLFNMAVIPLVSICYPIILISTALLCVFPISLFGVFPNVLFSFINYALYLANTELFMISGIRFSYSVLPYYLLAYSFAGKFNMSAKSYLILRIILLIALIFGICIVNLAY
ncbi:MAG: ComEC/Rec2 family competence protein [Clostridia bacterium]|nr:ComEC/Rec2 family competence protein [Clostridia bacterium]